MKSTISDFTIECHQEVMQLWQRCPGVGLSEADSRENMEIFLQRNPGLSFLARSGRGELVGTILAGHDGRRGYIYHLAVLPAHRRRGIGSTLVRRCLASLAAQGIGKCHIFVFADNDPGKRFWTAAGWSERADIRVFSGFSEI